MTLWAGLSALPIAVVFYFLVARRWPGAKAMGVGWVTASILGLAVWRMQGGWWATAAVYGGLQAMEIILTIFGAILLMTYLDRSGALATIRWHFTTIHGDRRIQLLLLGYGVITIIEGVAGFGTPAALVAPLMIGLGFPPLAAAVFSLWFNAPNPPFGVAGIPTLHGVGSVIGEVLPAGMESQFMAGVVSWVGVFTGTTYVVWGLLAVFFMLLWFGDGQRGRLREAWRGTWEVAGFAALLGLIAGGSTMLVARLLGGELPAITAGLLSLGAGLVCVRLGWLMPTSRWEFPPTSQWSDLWRGGLSQERLVLPQPQQQMPVLASWLPYLTVAGFLFLTRLPVFELVPRLQQITIGPWALFGSPLSWQLRPLYLPGVLPFLPVALLSGVLYGLNWTETRNIWRRAARQVLPAAITLVVSVSMAQIMIQSSVNALGQLGMIQMLSRVVASAAGAALPLVTPWIGILGAFMTGSNTSSNILFSALQYRAAEELQLSRTIITALQSTSGGIGNLISVLNVAAIAGVTGITGREGDVIRKTLVPLLLYALWVGLLGLLLVHTIGTRIF